MILVFSAIALSSKLKREGCGSEQSSFKKAWTCFLSSLFYSIFGKNSLAWKPARNIVHATSGNGNKWETATISCSVIGLS